MDFPDNPYYWGAVLAYKNGLTNRDKDGWFIDRIGQTSEIDQFSTISTSGSIGEYGLTFGLNINDKLYLGATIGIQSVQYEREVYYGEITSIPATYIPGSGDALSARLHELHAADRDVGHGYQLQAGRDVAPAGQPANRHGVPYADVVLADAPLRRPDEYAHLQRGRQPRRLPPRSRRILLRRRIRGHVGGQRPRLVELQLAHTADVRCGIHHSRTRHRLGRL